MLCLGVDSVFNTQFLYQDISVSPRVALRFSGVVDYHFSSVAVFGIIMIQYKAIPI